LLATSAAMAVARGNRIMGSFDGDLHGQAYTVMVIGADGTRFERAQFAPIATLSLIVAVDAPRDPASPASACPAS